MKILAASDIHGDTELVEKLAKRAENKKVDVVVLCGDITLAETNLEGLIGPFKKRGQKVLIIPGNHETIATIDFLTELYGTDDIKNLHGYHVVFKDKKGKKVGFFGCGGANIGYFQISDSEIENILKKGHDRIKRINNKIMITHVPPFNTKIDNLGWVNAGSEGLRKSIEKLQPDFCLCGHLHETFGKKDNIGKTKIINVGRDGKIIEI